MSYNHDQWSNNLGAKLIVGLVIIALWLLYLGLEKLYHLIF